MVAELYTFYQSLGLYVSNRILSGPNEEPGNLFWIRETSRDKENATGVVKIGKRLRSPLMTIGNAELLLPTNPRFFHDCHRLDYVARTALSKDYHEMLPNQRFEFRPVPERNIRCNTTVVYQELVTDLRYLFFEYVFPEYKDNVHVFEELDAFTHLARRMYDEDTIMPDVINWSNFFVVDKGPDSVGKKDLFRFLDSNPIPGKRSGVSKRYCASIEARLSVLEEICRTHERPDDFWKVFNS